jgi:hypothetical protein
MSFLILHPSGYTITLLHKRLLAGVSPVSKQVVDGNAVTSATKNPRKLGVKFREAANKKCL